MEVTAPAGNVTKAVGPNAGTQNKSGISGNVLLLFTPVKSNFVRPCGASTRKRRRSRAPPSNTSRDLPQ
jgi:hypothetical protein